MRQYSTEDCCATVPLLFSRVQPKLIALRVSTPELAGKEVSVSVVASVVKLSTELVEV